MRDWTALGQNLWPSWASGIRGDLCHTEYLQTALTSLEMLSGALPSVCMATAAWTCGSTRLCLSSSARARLNSSWRDLRLDSDAERFDCSRSMTDSWAWTGGVRSVRMIRVHQAPNQGYLTIRSVILLLSTVVIIVSHCFTSRLL